MYPLVERLQGWQEPWRLYHHYPYLQTTTFVMSTDQRSQYLIVHRVGQQGTRPVSDQAGRFKVILEEQDFEERTTSEVGIFPSSFIF